MKIKQLGNGGGLASALQGHVNSAFLIDLYDDHSEYLLFDIGYNIMKRLEEEERDDPHFKITKIKHLVVSHKHDDHCGNLETLIYWNYFKNNIQMNIYVACKGLAKIVKDTRKIVDNFEIIKAKTYKSLTIVTPKENQEIFYPIDRDINISFMKAFHGAKPALSFSIGNNFKYVYISGDTKANKHFEICCTSNHAGLIFHDYSNWDDESKNVHACKTDYKRIYSQKFRDKTIKYHTGSLDFNQDWQ